MSNFKSKEVREKYLTKYYGSGIGNLKALLYLELKKEECELNLELLILAMLKKDGFKPFTSLFKDNGKEFSQDSFNNFINTFLKVVNKSYDKYDNILKKDFLSDLKNKDLIKTFEKFIESIKETNLFLSLENIDNISKTLKINYNLDKKEIKNDWVNNTLNYMKNLNEVKNSEIFNFTKFINYNLKKDDNNFINCIETFIKESKTEQIIDFIEMLYKDINNNKDKYTTYLTLNILSDISDKLDYKLDLIKENIEDNNNEFNILTTTLSSNKLLNQDIEDMSNLYGNDYRIVKNVNYETILNKAEIIKDTIKKDLDSDLHEINRLKNNFSDLIKDFRDYNFDLTK